MKVQSLGEAYRQRDHRAHPDHLDHLDRHRRLQRPTSLEVSDYFF
jgi:hypothetical protein